MLIPEDTKIKIVELYNQGLLLKEISSIVNHPYPSITYILKKRIGYSNKRPNQGNIEYFKTVDNHNKAYILGYIAADGNITIDTSTNLMRLNLACNTKDKSILNFIKSEIGGEAVISDTQPLDKRTNKTYNRSSLRFGNQKLCKDLFLLGIYPNKTYNLPNILQNINKEYRKSLILGYFDGDGHIGASIDKRVNNSEYRTYRIEICGTEEILQGIADELNLNKYTINKYEHYCVLGIYNKIDFYNFYSCYEKIDFCLKRKKDIFLQRIVYERTISSPVD